MERSTVSALVLCILLGFMGCSSSGNLTNSMAENALKKWMPGSNAKVTGIQEIPQQNVATADVMFSNFSFTRNEQVFDPARQGFYEGWVPKTYSGPGVASFTHYNDGRWIMTRVVTSQGAQSTHWDDLSVEAR
jgi:hypothetical protein